MNSKSENNIIETWLVPGIAIVVALILCYFNIYLGLIALGLAAYATYLTIEKRKEKEDEIREFLDGLDIAFDGITKNAIFNMPFPISVLNSDNKMIWYNNNFKAMSQNKNSLVEKNIVDIFPNLKLDDDQDIFEFDDKKYRIYKNEVKDKDGKNLKLIYFLDDTGHQDLIDDYMNSQLVVLSMHIDNYDEIVTDTPGERRPLLFAQIDRIISLYFHQYGATIKKYESDKYIGILTNKQLDSFEEDKWSFIERVRETKIGNSIPPTLSIGLGKSENTPRDNEKSANAALDIALGRGGDQVVIKEGEELRYYGGKNKATQKRTKVKARVIAHALGQLIDKSTEVFIMGHKNPDMDSFGSALGLLQAVQRRNSDGYLVLAEVTPAIKNLYQRAIDSIEGLEDMIITPDQAYDKVRASSLLIVTDNHRKNSTEEPRLFEATNQIFLIDHHRRGKDYIDNATLIYMEPYASSSSELVTEMLMYMEEEVQIHEVVAEGLLAGITVDTKNFFYQTGVRTFEAASVLKRHGADSMVVKNLFKDDIELMRYKSEIISQAEKYRDRFAIGIFDRELDSSTLIASQAADDLLNAEGIDASFVITKANGRTHISARSLGTMSVQLIMEAMNGGGHLTSAATQLDVSIEEAKVQLQEAIDGYKDKEK